jgi:nucleoid DNA-binding protein
MDNKILKELIENNPRVILPDFGAFLVKDDGTKVFKPENISFSPFLRYNDGMVEDYLATSQKVSKDQAKTFINSFIEEVKSELQSKKIYTIGGLGSLQIDARGSIQFTTQAVTAQEQNTQSPKKQEEKTLTKDKIVRTPPLVEEKKKIDTPEQKPNDIKESPPEVTKVEKTEKPNESSVDKPIAPIPEPSDKKTAKEPSTQKTQLETKVSKPMPTPEIQVTSKKTSEGGTAKAILYGTLIGIGFVTIMASGWYLYNTGFFSSSKTATIKSVKKEIPAAGVETISESLPKPQNEKGRFEEEFKALSTEMDESINQEEKKVGEIKPADKRISETLKTEDAKISITYPQEGLFHIIAGSFRNAAYAEKFSNDMKTSGYNSKVIAQPTGMHAVSLGSFLTREEAVDSMDRWKLKHPNIWILKQ